MTQLTQLSRSVENKVVLITGAASGIGRACARVFAAEGAHVGLIDLNPSVTSEVLTQLSSAGATSSAQVVDITDAAALEAAITAIRSELGPIDILVNDAGVSAPAAIDSPDYYDAWDRTMAVNLMAQSMTVRACLEDLKRNRSGRIVNVASTEGLGATAFGGAYTASKHGVIGLTKSLAVELGRSGVTANCVCPGPIATGMTEAIPDEHKTKFARRRVPVGRYGKPEEVAQAILSLALPAASYINGAVLPVDGGMTSQNT